MAEEILSQDEIDALLRGIEGGEVETETAEAPSGIRPYDFTSQEKIVRGKMPSLDIINERLARSFRISLASDIRKIVDVVNVNVNITKFYDFLRSVPFPSSLNIIRLEPLRGFSLVVFDAPMIFTLIEFYFGGTGKGYYKPEGREFTPIEQRIIHKVVMMFLESMEEAWKPVFPIKPQYVRTEMNPQFVTIVTPVDVVIEIEFILEIETRECRIMVCIPYSSVEPIKDKLYSAFLADRDEMDMKWIGRIKAQIKQAPILIEGVLGKVTIDFKTLLDLKTGDVITLQRRIDEDIDLLVEGIPKFKGKLGTFKGNYAIKITEEA
ncbi:MAG: flagellar motor switch protein FliM [Thermodesulfovibrio sp.]|uniref:flagellar motor switch protein FliM n=1 Tax=unclassified Thermodesulfovibrio TaxID=2645936 RepID=UPI00083AD2AD|nr:MULTISPECIES: flagellar motor switch protein FliM [unclassified Thermodesulfovibrio]MDI1471814.1 flagellar motor switch protein FliM [Thermodesulfovibrio sp. 1176]MDI6713704.1 flagellar motor switch protein FliM [Thermodesulfovibrio sp.]ODA43323.1 Flagellar motor switch protein FliM [Thermodesulfovibrio sp. N1]